MDRLHKKGYISDPALRGTSVVLTEEGLAEATRLAEKMFTKAHLASYAEMHYNVVHEDGSLPLARFLGPQDRFGAGSAAAQDIALSGSRSRSAGVANEEWRR